MYICIRSCLLLCWQQLLMSRPFSVREGGMIRSGFDLELDELHSIASDNKTWMQNFELKIKEETGIKTLKVGYNKVFWLLYRGI